VSQQLSGFGDGSGGDLDVVGDRLEVDGDDFGLVRRRDDGRHGVAQEGALDVAVLAGHVIGRAESAGCILHYKDSLHKFNTSVRFGSED